MAPRKYAYAAVLATAVLTAGCGSSSTTSSPAPTTTAAVSTTIAAPSTPSASPSPPPATPSSPPPAPSPSTTAPNGGPPPCLTKQLSTIDKPGAAGVGHAGIVLVFTNKGSTCTLSGYPGVDGVRDGTAVVHAQRTLSGYLGGAPSVATVTLTVGQSASALLEGFGAPVSGQPCTAYTSLLVTPPNNQESAPLTSRAPLCSPQIHPVVKGAAGGAKNS